MFALKFLNECNGGQLVGEFGLTTVYVYRLAGVSQKSEVSPAVLKNVLCGLVVAIYGCFSLADIFQTMPVGNTHGS